MNKDLLTLYTDFDLTALTSYATTAFNAMELKIRTAGLTIRQKAELIMADCVDTMERLVGNLSILSASFMENIGGRIDNALQLAAWFDTEHSFKPQTYILSTKDVVSIDVTRQEGVGVRTTASLSTIRAYIDAMLTWRNIVSTGSILGDLRIITGVASSTILDGAKEANNLMSPGIGATPVRNTIMYSLENAWCFEERSNYDMKKIYDFSGTMLDYVNKIHELEGNPPRDVITSICRENETIKDALLRRVYLMDPYDSYVSESILTLMDMVVNYRTYFSIDVVCGNERRTIMQVHWGGNEYGTLNAMYIDDTIGLTNTLFSNGHSIASIIDNLQEMYTSQDVTRRVMAVLIQGSEVASKLAAMTQGLYSRTTPAIRNLIDLFSDKGDASPEAAAQVAVASYQALASMKPAAAPGKIDWVTSPSCIETNIGTVIGGVIASAAQAIGSVLMISGNVFGMIIGGVITAAGAIYSTTQQALGTVAGTIPKINDDYIDPVYADPIFERDVMYIQDIPALIRSNCEEALFTYNRCKIITPHFIVYLYNYVDSLKSYSCKIFPCINAVPSGTYADITSYKLNGVKTDWLDTEYSGYPRRLTGFWIKDFKAASSWGYKDDNNWQGFSNPAMINAYQQFSPNALQCASATDKNYADAKYWVEAWGALALPLAVLLRKLYAGYGYTNDIEACKHVAAVFETVKAACVRSASEWTEAEVPYTTLVNETFPWIKAKLQSKYGRNILNEIIGPYITPNAVDPEVIPYFTVVLPFIYGNKMNIMYPPRRTYESVMSTIIVMGVVTAAMVVGGMLLGRALRILGAKKQLIATQDFTARANALKERRDTFQPGWKDPETGTTYTEEERLAGLQQCEKDLKLMMKDLRKYNFISSILGRGTFDVANAWLEYPASGGVADIAAEEQLTTFLTTALKADANANANTAALQDDISTTKSSLSTDGEMSIKVLYKLISGSDTP